MALSRLLLRVDMLGIGIPGCMAMAGSISFWAQSSFPLQQYW